MCLEGVPRDFQGDPALPVHLAEKARPPFLGVREPQMSAFLFVHQPLATVDVPLVQVQTEVLGHTSPPWMRIAAAGSGTAALTCSGCRKPPGPCRHFAGRGRPDTFPGSRPMARRGHPPPAAPAVDAAYLLTEPIRRRHCLLCFRVCVRGIRGRRSQRGDVAGSCWSVAGGTAGGLSAGRRCGFHMGERFSIGRRVPGSSGAGSRLTPSHTQSKYWTACWSGRFRRSRSTK